MISVAVVFYSSLSTLLVYCVLLMIEGKRGQRVLLGGVRAWIDMQLERASARLFHQRQLLREGVIRHTMHFLFHKILKFLLVLVGRLDAFLRALLRGNKRIVKTTIAPESESEYLQAVKDHADTVKLSDEEKRQKRQDLLK